MSWFLNVIAKRRSEDLRKEPKGVFEAGRIETADNCASWFEGPND